jgi:hypothetical protein
VTQSGNAVLKVRGEATFSGSLDSAIERYKELQHEGKLCATLLTEGRTYFGLEQIDEFVATWEFCERINSTVEVSAFLAERRRKAH